MSNLEETPEVDETPLQEIDVLDEVEQELKELLSEDAESEVLQKESESEDDENEENLETKEDLEVESEDDEKSDDIVISLDEDEEDSQPNFVKLRNQYKQTRKELKETRRQLEEIAKQKEEEQLEKVLPKKPQMEDYYGNEEKYEQELLNWHKVKENEDQKKREIELQQEQRNQRFQEKVQRVRSQI